MLFRTHAHPLLQISPVADHRRRGCRFLGVFERFFRAAIPSTHPTCRTPGCGEWREGGKGRRVREGGGRGLVLKPVPSIFIVHARFERDEAVCVCVCVFIFFSHYWLSLFFFFSPQECKLPGFSSCITIHPPRDSKSTNIKFVAISLFTPWVEFLTWHPSLKLTCSYMSFA